MSGNTSQYNRLYFRDNRGKILQRRKERYWTDSQYRTKMREKTRLRRLIDKTFKVRRENADILNKNSRLILVGDRSIRVFNKAALARFLNVTRPTIDNWHREGILQVPQDIDALGRFWYREDYLIKVNSALGKYNMKLRKGVLAEKIRIAFSGESYDKKKN